MASFVGRDRQLERIVGAIEPGASPSVAAIVAAGGLGKSRLLDEVRRSSERPTVVIRVLEDPFRPFDWIRLLLRELGVGWVPDESTLTPEEQRWELAATLSETLADNGPVLAAIDDLHKAEDQALEILDRALAQASGTWALVVASRPDGRPAIQSILRRSVVVELAPLVDESVAILADAFGLELPVAQIQAITAGSPLLIDQLARGVDSDARGLDILRGRIKALPADTRRLLAFQALDPDLPDAILAEAMGVEDLEPMRNLARNRAVIDDNGRFVHDLVGEAARSSPDLRSLSLRLSDAWSTIDSIDGRIEACRHSIAAIPKAAPELVAHHALELADHLVSIGRPDAAQALLTPLLDALADHDPGNNERRAQVLVCLADAQWAMGEMLPSVRLGAEAAEIAAFGSDVMLQARAELAATRQHDTIQPDPDRMDRVMSVVGALPEDSAIRGRLLGRASVLAMTALDIERAHRLADEGLDLAARLGDPALEGQLLTDRHLCVVDRAGAEQRERLGERLIGLGAHARRSDLSLVGYQWIAGTRILRGDLAGAADELDRLAIRATLRPPSWQLVVQFRRMTLAGMIGPREAALELAAETWERFGDLLGEQERPGVEYEFRSALARLYGVADPDIEQLHARLYGRPLPPVPFINVRAGMKDLLAGDVERIRPIVSRWAPRSTMIVRSFMGLPTMAVLATMAAAVGDGELSQPVVDALLPFSGLLACDNGIGVNPPVDTLIAMNLLATRELERAAEYADAGVELAETTGADPLMDRARSVQLAVEEASGRGLAEALGAYDVLALRSGAPVNADQSAHTSLRSGRMVRDGKMWRFESPYGSGTVTHTRGVEQLARVLAAAGSEVAAVDLAGFESRPATDLGPALDATAKRAYRRRISDLEAEIEEARRFNDPGRVERASVELDLITEELRSAVGLGGRDRPQGSGHERSRVNVTRSIRRAIDAFTDAAPDLGAHLSVSVNTGGFCVYRPDPVAAVVWEIVR